MSEKEKKPAEVFDEIWVSWVDGMNKLATDVKHRGQLLNLHYRFLDDLKELAPLLEAKVQKVEQEVYTEGYDE